MKRKLYEVLALVAACEAVAASFQGQFLILLGSVAVIPLLGLGWLYAVLEQARS